MRTAKRPATTPATRTTAVTVGGTLTPPEPTTTAPDAWPTPGKCLDAASNITAYTQTVEMHVN